MFVVNLLLSRYISLANGQHDHRWTKEGSIFQSYLALVLKLCHLSYQDIPDYIIPRIAQNILHLVSTLFHLVLPEIRSCKDSRNTRHS